MPSLATTSRGISAMPFKRFLIWLVEKLFELNLAVAAVLIVEFFLPLSPDAYVSLDAFAAGVRDTYAGAVEDAAYVTSGFMGGSWWRYAANTWLAALWVVVLYGYLASLYLFLSLLACLLGERNHVRNALIAYGLAAAFFVWRFVHAWDADMWRLLSAMIVLGLGIAAWSAWLGEGLYGSGQKATRGGQPSSRRRVRLDLSA